MRETIRITTNDPKLPSLNLAVFGKVEKFAQIQPERVLFTGPAGKPLSAEVVVVPRPEYPFTIREVTARDGSQIGYRLEERCSDGRNRCVIRLENLRTDRGRYADTVYLVTDSPIRPRIPIVVTGMIQ